MILDLGHIVCTNSPSSNSVHKLSSLVTSESENLAENSGNTEGTVDEDEGKCGDQTGNSCGPSRCAAAVIKG